ncbi:MAG: hypothetical protein Q8K63_11530 [Acidimicrobiales bacterium]|nr:hypothetical protein [Acidimicrobiales bacterium]
MTTTTAPTTTTIGAALIDRLMAGDGSSAAALLAPNAQFRAITPRKFIEQSGPEAIVATFNNWFRAGWREDLETFEDGAVEGRERMRYRVRWSDDYGQRFVFEQQVYYEADGSGITWIELMCSGHMPLAG